MCCKCLQVSVYCDHFCYVIFGCERALVFVWLFVYLLLLVLNVSSYRRVVLDSSCARDSVAQEATRCGAMIRLISEEEAQMTKKMTKLMTK